MAGVRIERDRLLDLGESLGRTWWLPDGRGGCASGTVVGCAADRRHGLLCVPFEGAPRPHLLLSRFEEEIRGGGRSMPLSLALYPGGLHPAGHQYLDLFESLPRPRWTFRIGDVTVVREVRTVAGRSAVLVRWTVSGGGGAGAPGPEELLLRPFLPCREAGALTHRNVYLDDRVRAIPGGVAARPYPSLPEVAITAAPTGRWTADPHWYADVRFEEDGATEDQWTPGVLAFPAAPGARITVAVSADGPVADPEAAWRAAERAGRGPARAGRRRAGLRAALEASAASFAVTLPGGRPSVAPSWPSPGERGRATFLALPGLALVRGGGADAAAILAGAIPWFRDGLLPGEWSARPGLGAREGAEPALRWLRAADLLAAGKGGGALLRERILPAAVDAVLALAESRAPEATRDAAGLLAGGPGSTWMAGVDRPGCAVEVNGLWLAALDFGARAARRLGKARAAARLGALRARAGRAFVGRFWLEEEGRLADRWHDGVADRVLRPNMVVAASLAAVPLPRARRAAVVAAAAADLLTPRGLRTLSPRDPAYRGSAPFGGAAHPWLLGAWADALVLARGRTAAVRREIAARVGAFAAHLGERGLGHVSERFDGDAPHRPAGAPADAAAAGELLRALRLAGPGGA